MFGIPDMSSWTSNKIIAWKITAGIAMLKPDINNKIVK